MVVYSWKKLNNVERGGTQLDQPSWTLPDEIEQGWTQLDMLGQC